MADDERPRTQRDVPGRADTQREAAGPGMTQREGEIADDALVRLPSALRDEYESLGELDTRWGGEAALLRARRRRDGLEVVVKVYNRGIELSEAVLRGLRDANSDHVVRLYDYGESNGRWYEVQEYLQGGTLLDYTTSRRVFRAELDAIVEELGGAIAHLHELGVLHRDLKPANVLVRQRLPLDLVVSDFGLASMTKMSMRAVSKSRTFEYSAPELRFGVAGWPSDWWSFGMTVAELAAGAHPFEGQQEKAVDYALFREPVPLGGIEDPELLHLCRGLLVRDPERRWGWPQVQQWLRGEAPPPPPDVTVVPAPGDAGDPVAFVFDRQPYTDPASLARAFCASWPNAARLVAGSNQRDELVAWARRFSTDGRVSRLLDDWNESEPPPDKRLAQVLVVLDPDLGVCPFPEFAEGGGVSRLVDLVPESLAGLADEVLSAPPDSPAARLLEVAFEQRILEVYAPIEPRLTTVDERWRVCVERTLKLVGAAASRSLLPVGQLQGPVRARALQIATEDEAVVALRRAAASASRSIEGLPEWYQELTRLPQERTGGPEIALVLLRPAAQEQGERAARAEQEAQDRARIERREARQRGLATATERTSRGLKMTTVGVALVAFATYLVHRSEVDLRQRAFDLAIDGHVGASEWLVRAADWSRWYPWLTGLVFAGVIGVALSRWLASNPGSANPLAVQRGLQSVTVLQVVSVPVLAPFALRWAFVSRARNVPDTANRSLRRWTVVGSVLLASQTIGLEVLRRTTWWGDIVTAWPPDVQQRYYDSWPRSLDPTTIANDFGWTARWAALIAVVGLVLAWRSYTVHDERERWACSAVLMVGVVGAAVTLPIAASVCVVVAVFAIVSWTIVAMVG